MAAGLLHRLIAYSVALGVEVGGVLMSAAVGMWMLAFLIALTFPLTLSMLLWEASQAKHNPFVEATPQAEVRQQVRARKAA